jgi:hypothetical protein
MQSMLEELCAATIAGASLALLSLGCASEVRVEKTESLSEGGRRPATSAAGSGSGGATSGATSSATSGATSSASSGGLSPYSLADLGCFGPKYHDDFGYHGQCCVSALCYTPDTGGCAPAADAAGLVPGFPPGSGECDCSGPEGPYAPNPDDTPPYEGTCCYLVGSIGCDGRALLIEGLARRAGVVRRRDWLRGVVEAELRPLA